MAVDRFVAEPDPCRKNGWRVMRIDQNGERFDTPRRFRKEATAKAWAYQLEVKAERRHNRFPYLGD